MKRCLAGLCLLLMLLSACTARPSQTPVTAKDDAARRAWLEQQGWQTEEQPVRTLTVQLSLAGQEDYLALQQEAACPWRTTTARPSPAAPTPSPITPAAPEMCR